MFFSGTRFAVHALQYPMTQIKLTKFRLPVEVSQYIIIQKALSCEQVALSPLLKRRWYWSWRLCASVPNDIIFQRYPKTSTSGNYAWSKVVHWNPQEYWGCKFAIKNFFSIKERGRTWRERQTAAAEETFWQVREKPEISKKAGEKADVPHGEPYVLNVKGEITSPQMREGY